MIFAPATDGTPSPRSDAQEEPGHAVRDVMQRAKAMAVNRRRRSLVRTSTSERWLAARVPERIERRLPTNNASQAASPLRAARDSAVLLGSRPRMRWVNGPALRRRCRADRRGPAPGRGRSRTMMGMSGLIDPALLAEIEADAIRGRTVMETAVAL